MQEQAGRETPKIEGQQDRRTHRRIPGQDAQWRGSHRNGTGDTIGPTELGALAQKLTGARRRDGIAKADADWFDRPLDEWLSGLQGGSGLSRSSIVELGVGMTHSLAMRDAIIISMVATGRSQTSGGGDGDKGGVNKRLLIGFASRPHDPGNAARMGQLLARAFEDEAARIDAARCRNGIEMLSTMVRTLPDEYVVQPLAVIAYITWWMGEGSAGDVALRALSLDSGCTLAAIVCSALRHGVWPAWLRREAAGDSANSLQISL